METVLLYWFRICWSTQLRLRLPGPCVCFLQEEKAWAQTATGTHRMKRKHAADAKLGKTCASEVNEILEIRYSLVKK